MSAMFDPGRKVIFVNLVILDASEAVRKRMSQKFKRMPKPLKTAATKMITSLATPERVAEAMSNELPKKLVVKMAKKGLSAVAQLVFLEGPYMVIQMQVQKVSTEIMMEAQVKKHYDHNDGELEQQERSSISRDFAERIIECVRRILFWIGIRRQRSLEEDYLPRLVQSNMDAAMDEVVKEKLQKRGLEAISKVLPEAQQARFFYDTLREVRDVY